MFLLFRYVRMSRSHQPSPATRSLKSPRPPAGLHRLPWPITSTGERGCTDTERLSPCGRDCSCRPWGGGQRSAAGNALIVSPLPNVPDLPHPRARTCHCPAGALALSPAKRGSATLGALLPPSSLERQNPFPPPTAGETSTSPPQRSCSGNARRRGRAKICLPGAVTDWSITLPIPPSGCCEQLPLSTAAAERCLRSA